jgi:tetratricopeptide (TPR) repeat protein
MSLVAGLVLLASAAHGAAADPATPYSLDEKIVLVAPTGQSKEDVDILGWQKRIRAEHDAGRQALGSYERLGWAYVSKARRTLDAGYYKLAEKTADVMDARYGKTDDALLLRGHVFHNLHRFREAEAAARQLVASRGLAFDYALLSDALMEEGRLDESVAACGKMMALKPGLEAYSRAANLRWLTGDLDGAIQAMEAAVRAGSPVDAAATAWTLARLSSYYLQAGRAEAALRVSRMAEALAADYPPALFAEGKAQLALGHPDAASIALRRAEALNPLPEYQWWLADALRSGGDPARAGAVEADLRAKGEAADPRTYALYLATRGADAGLAVRMARAELANREDVFTEDALAWALASSGDYAAAEKAMGAALAAHTLDARLFLHAGEIAFRRGEAEAARGYFARAARYALTLTPSERSLLARRVGTAPVALAP